MFSKFNHIKVSLVLLGILLCIIPFSYDHKEELMIVVVFLIAFVLISYLLLPKKQTELKNRLVELEIHNMMLSSHLDELLVSLPVPLAVIDNNLNLLLSNLSFKQIFPQFKTDLKEIDHSIKKVINQALLSSGSTRQSMFLNGREYLLISNHLTFNQKMSTMLLFNDVTAYMEAQKAHKRFIADASHELKTPITSILGMSEILATREVDDQTSKEFMLQINKETIRLQNIVADLLELSKLSSNRIILNYSSFDFSDLVKDVYHSLKNQFINKGLIFIYDFAPKHVYLDYDKMHQVFTNLLANAITYSDQGKITLDVLVNDLEFQMKLKDEGIGIEQKHINHLFERFYRIDSSRTRPLGGSGLGLSIVKDIIDAHHGNIEILSEPNRGTEVIVMIKNQS